MPIDGEYYFVRSLVGANIARIRDERGLSQSEFARRFSINRSYLNSIESGKQNVSMHELIRIADGLDVPFARLFDGLEKDAPCKMYEYAAIKMPKTKGLPESKKKKADPKGLPNPEKEDDPKRLPEAKDEQEDEPGAAT